MSLAKGTKLGPYEVLTSLGAGGMGEVFRARDSRLGRDVALKILPPELARSGARRQRFEQEARAIGALNHPNIVAIYDLGEQDGIAFIVTELVDGESLRAIIERGPSSLRGITDIAGQAGDGLSAAHSAGIAHRDLKPENIMVNHEGRVKILDFGLAKQISQADNSLTTSGTHGGASPTDPGTLLGTVNYMSPEQARGKDADHRTDIFSLGVILYEMLAGRRPFRGDTTTDTLAAILREEPPELPEQVPPALAQTVLHCLEKDPRQRFQSAADLAFAVRNLGSVSGTTGKAPVIARPRWQSYILPAAAAATLAAGFMLARILAPEQNDVFSFRRTPVPIEQADPFLPTFSPDGKSIAFNALVDGVTQVFTQKLDATSAVQLTRGFSSARYPSWSPDQSRIYYVGPDRGGRAVMSVALAGGEAQRVLGGLGAYNGFDGMGLSPAGDALAVVKPDSSSNKWSVWISSPPGAEPLKYQPAPFERPERSGRARLRFSPDGKHLLLAYLYDETPPEFWLLPWPQQASGVPHRIFASVDFPTSNATVNWMPDSRRVVLCLLRSSYNDSHIWLGDTVTGKLRQLTAGENAATDANVSPDGKAILYAAVQREMDAVELPLDGSPRRDLLATRRRETGPAWSPVGEQFAYVTDRRGRIEIWIKSVREGWNRPIVTPGDLENSLEAEMQTPSFSRDGSRIAYSAIIGRRQGIWISAVNGGPAVSVNTGGESFCQTPSWSPDGTWLSFLCLKGGRSRVFRVHLGAQQPPLPVKDSDVASFYPQWSPDGRWITILTREGFGVVSPDGQETRILAPRFANAPDVAHGWSRDGSTIYVLSFDRSRAILAAFDARTGAERKIADYGSGFAVAGLFTGTLGLSLSPDGKSLATSTRIYHDEIWMLEGFDPPQGLLPRLWSRMGLKL